MRSFYSLCLSVLFVAVLTSQDANGQVAKAFAIEVHASAAPANITVTWKPVPDAPVYIVRRRLYGETVWGKENFVDVPGTEFVDTDVEPGKIYEYRVGVPGGKSVYGFITSGYAVPARGSEGTLLLLVGETAANTAAEGLETYTDDLVRVGWNVEKQVVSETATPQEIKSKILEVSGRLGSQLRSLFLFGRVPVPYSGVLAPDGHVEDHFGAWPADGYYGDLDGNWTDVTANNTSAARAENRNIPGDGKFDQSNFPSKIELEVGRVDFRKMGWFYLDAASQEEREARLLNNYLKKDHKFRLAQLPNNGKSVISDVIGELGPNDVPAAIAWRAFPILTEDVQPTTDWMNKLSAEPHLWAYGAGYGNYFVAEGVGTTEDYSKRDPKAIFTMLFGSRFGDWDTVDNLLRAPLGTSTGLASMWAGRPYWYVHQMAMGMTIGEATRQSQSASASYIATFNEGNVEMALMGDPTLHNMEVPLEVTGLVLSGADQLQWNDVGGNTKYIVSRGPSRRGPFTPLTADAITSTTYSIPTPNNEEPFYLVRPVIPVSKWSGEFFQSGRGAIINILNSVHTAEAENDHLTLRGDAIVVQDVQSSATLSIIDVLGRTIAERVMNSGESFDPTSLSAGAYIAQLHTSRGTEVMRFNR